MPVEIKELIIRANVERRPLGRGEGEGEPGEVRGPAPAPIKTDDIVRECVRQVMKILERRGER